MRHPAYRSIGVVLQLLAAFACSSALAQTKTRKIVAPSGLPSRPPLKPQKQPTAATKTSQINTRKPASKGPVDWTKTASSWLYEVHSKSSGHSASLAQSWALAVEGQYLLVPSDFISTSWMQRRDLKFFVGSEEARVVALDVPSNVALLRTRAALPRSMTRDQLQTDIPDRGELLYTLVGRELIQPGSRFIQSQTGLYQIINGTPSQTGFLFDRKGKLISLVSSAQAGMRVWAASGFSLRSLLDRRQKAIEPAEERKQQMVQLQNRFFAALMKSLQQTASELQCQAHLVTLEPTDLLAQIDHGQATACATQSVPSGAGYLAGAEHRAARLTLSSPFTSEQLASFTQAFASDWFKTQATQSQSVNLMTQAECKQSVISNPSGQTVHVRFCTSALKQESLLSDTVVSMALQEGSELKASAVWLKGFNLENSKTAIESLTRTTGALR